MPSTWNAELATGVAALDSDHFDFINRINRVLEDQQGLRTLDGALGVLDYLENVVLHHFIEEEEQMLAVDYPGMLSHRAEHGRLTEYVISARHRIATPDLELLIVSNRLLCSWLLEHLNTADRELAGHMQHSRGLSSARHDSQLASQRPRTKNRRGEEGHQILAAIGEHQGAPTLHLHGDPRRRYR